MLKININKHTKSKTKSRLGYMADIDDNIMFTNMLEYRTPHNLLFQQTPTPL